MKVCLFNNSNCSHPSLEVAVYLFLSLKGRQSSIPWSVLCRFHWLCHCCHSLSLIAICCHSLSLVVLLLVTLCHLLHHSLSFVVTRCTTRCHSLSLDVPLVCLFINDLFVVTNRFTDYKAGQKKASFHFPKDQELKQKLIYFVNRKDLLPTVHSVICIDQFEEKVIKCGKKCQLM